MGYLDDLLRRAGGRVGRSIDLVGSAFGNPLPERNLSERLEYSGARPLTTQQRIDKSYANTGGIAEGDYSTAVNAGYSPYIPSRADGGILTSQQQGQNRQTTGQVLGAGDTRRQHLEKMSSRNPIQEQELQQLIGDDGGGGGIDYEALLQAERDRAQGIYDESVRRAGEGFDRARGIYDEGSSLLGQRRGEFQDFYDTSTEDIFNRFQQGRSNLQASAKGARQRAANSLRAQGIAGSGAFNYEGRQAQEQASQLGGLSESRAFNDRENLRGFNEQQTFANTQESALERYLKDAASAQTDTINQASLIQQGEGDRINQQAASIYDQILQSQLAMNMANQATGSYQANPYQVNIPQTFEQISTQVPLLGGGQTADSGAGINIDPTSYLDPNKRRIVGGSLYQ